MKRYGSWSHTLEYLAIAAPVFMLALICNNIDRFSRSPDFMVIFTVVTVAGIVTGAIGLGAIMIVGAIYELNDNLADHFTQERERHKAFGERRRHPAP